MSLRLPEGQAAELAAVARTDDVKISEAVREAIDVLNHRCRRDIAIIICKIIHYVRSFISPLSS